MTRERPEVVAPGRRQPARSWVRRAAWVVVPLALVGEAGHQLLGRLGQTLAHHLFHILFAGVAAVAFLVYAIWDIRRSGWPTFTWRLRRPPEDPPTAR